MDRYSDEMYKIEDILDSSGFDFNIHGKNGWEQKVEEKYGYLHNGAVK